MYKTKCSHCKKEVERQNYTKSPCCFVCKMNRVREYAKEYNKK